MKTIKKILTALFILALALTSLRIPVASADTPDDGSLPSESLTSVTDAVYAVTGVSLDQKKLYLASGTTAALSATVSPENATDKSLSWSSSDSNVATVGANGVVTAIGSGSATITVTTTDGSFTASSIVTVNLPEATNVTIAKAYPYKDYFLIGNYDYYTNKVRKGNASTYQWYRANNPSGDGKQAVTDAVYLTYTPTAGDVGKYLRLEVTPNNGYYQGLTVASGWIEIRTPEGDGLRSTPFSGTLTTEHVFKRPEFPDTATPTGVYDAESMTSVSSDDFNYFYYNVIPDTSGDYMFWVKDAAIDRSDSVVFVYKDQFDASSPLTNLIAGNDDMLGFGIYGNQPDRAKSYIPMLHLDAGKTYILVMTTWQNGESGDVSFQSLGPGTLQLIKPNPINDLTAAAGNGKVKLTFSAAARSTSVRIEQSTDEVTWTQAATTGTIDSSTTSAWVTGLTNGDMYHFRLVVTGGDRMGISNVDGAMPLASLISNDATLSDMTISAGTLNPVFVSGTSTYRTNVGSNVANITVTPTVSEDHATVKVAGQTVSSGHASNPIPLNGGDNTIQVVVTAEDGQTSNTYTITVSRANPPAQSESGNLQQTTAVEVLVNGKIEKAGTATTSVVNNRTVTTVSVDQNKLDEKLAAEGRKAVITIPIKSADSDVVVGELNGQMIKNMEQKEAVVEIKTGNAAYTLPAQQININAVSDQLGQNLQLQDIKVQIEIASPPSNTVKLVESTAAAGQFTIVAPPLDFTVRGTYGGKTVEVSKFIAYVERMIAIPDGVDPQRITTGIVIEPDGTVRHVPTKIVVEDGKYYAKVSSLTNSTYSVVWHPIEFQDVAAHWSKDAVNDMGSRMVIKGISDQTFAPDQAITRAEFAAILVRALGLKLEKGTSFSDVKASDWYGEAIHTAKSYDLISGFKDGSFQPNRKITREEAMTVISKAMKLAGLRVSGSKEQAKASLEAYSDATLASAWAVDGLADCLQAGIVSGRANHRLAPLDSITRAEVAVIVQRLLQKADLI
ncbi:S-layer homology domain-containing protein [Cohnella candidum]|uniref:SLH domain-containing protein n=1 Tax=Cohnella candidum TaxID=2674991 RepID=A0A3G3K3Z3_9BACL|nr:S-layer homology domain-containing protein [Cohnella candidum]AYQ75178.1 hypothetical protein EAV92_23085 [Cohnella candidum]